MKDEISTRSSYREEQDPLGPKIAMWLVVMIITYLVVSQ